jgi:hypothetical protein
MESLFRGPFFDYVMSQEPLCSAEYFAYGSSAMLFQRNGKLYRLTTDGSGHNFLSEQSASGNSTVVHVIEDFGAVAPNDECPDDEYYWLAQVEWLQPLDPESPQGARLKELFSALTEDDAVFPEQREQFIRLCEQAVFTHAEFDPLLNTLIKAAKYLSELDGIIDANITNVMVRSSTGAIVWSDPIHDPMSSPTDEQEAKMVAIREQVARIGATI